MRRRRAGSAAARQQIMVRAATSVAPMTSARFSERLFTEDLLGEGRFHMVKEVIAEVDNYKADLN